MSDKARFIRELCEDKFEGIPCSYPDCRCSKENRQEMEDTWLDEIEPPAPSTIDDGMGGTYRPGVILTYPRKA